MSSVLGATQPASHDFSYPGSRRRRARYACGGFIELSPAASAGKPEMVVNAFRQSLTAVRGVDRVELHPKGSKTQQGNHGKHYQDHNFAVFSSKNPKVFMEFELTRHQHMDKEPFTVTALYKNPIKPLIPEAWRILRSACQGKELLPDWVVKMEQIILKNWQSEYGGESNTEPVLDAPFLDDDTDSETARRTSDEIEWLKMKTADPLPIQHGDGVRWQGDGDIPADPVAGAAPSSLSEHGEQMHYDIGDGDLGALPAAELGYNWEVHWGDESGAAPDDEPSEPDSPITAGPYPGSSASTAVGVLIPQQARDNLAQFKNALEHGLVPPPPLYEIPNIIDDGEDPGQVDQQILASYCCRYCWAEIENGDLFFSRCSCGRLVTESHRSRCYTTGCYPPCRHLCEHCGPLHQCTDIDGRPVEELTESDDSDFGMAELTESHGRLAQVQSRSRGRLAHVMSIPEIAMKVIACEHMAIFIVPRALRSNRCIQAVFEESKLMSDLPELISQSSNEDAQIPQWLGTTSLDFANEPPCFFCALHDRRT